jgi:hypothetical protein
MLDALVVYSEYIQLAGSVFEAIGNVLFNLFNSICYLLVGVGQEEPDVQPWRWMTPSEVGNVVFSSQVPEHSKVLYQLFCTLSVYI